MIKITYCFIRGNWTEFRSQIHIGWFTNASKFSFQGFYTPFWPPWVLENTCMDRQTDRQTYTNNKWILERKTRVDILFMVYGAPGLWSLWGVVCGLCIFYFAEIKYYEQKQLQRSRNLQCQSGKTWHGVRSRELSEPLYPYRKQNVWTANQERL